MLSKMLNWVSSTGPNRKHTALGAAHFKHTHARYQKTLLFSFLVQSYVCSAGHNKSFFVGIVHLKRTHTTYLGRIKE